MATYKNQFTLEVETRNFNAHIKDFMSKTSLGADVVLKKFAFDLIQRIVMKSPVDTGRSRAGWYPAINYLTGGQGIEIRGVNKQFIAGKKGERQLRADASAVAEGFAQGSIRDHTGISHLDKWIEIVNGVEYVIYLEYGHSQQAPYGMIRISMRELSGQKLPQEMKKMIQQKWNLFYLTGPGGVLLSPIRR